MSLGLIDAIGFAAGACGIVGFVPQLIKIARDKDAKEVSLAMYAITSIGFVLWVAYGVLEKSWPVMLSNSIMLALVAAILVLTVRYGDRRR